MKQQSAKQERKPISSRKLSQKLLHAVTNNIGYKILALLIALVLWGTLITQDPTLTREKTFTGVTVTISGTEALKRNGYIVTSDLTSLLDDVTVKAAVPQGKYNDAQVSAYNVRVDLSKVTGTGTTQLRISSTASGLYGSVTDISPAVIPITVEAYTTRYRIPVSIVTEGTAPEGYYVTSPSVSPSVITVSGPKSIVDTIGRAQVVINLSDLPAAEGTVRTALPLQLQDRQGNPIESSLIEITSESVLLDSVIIEQDVYPTAEIRLSDANLVTGTPAAGYEVKSVTFTPAVIVAAGPSSVLESLDALFASSTLDVTGLSETVTRSPGIRKPADLVNLTPSSFTITVEIGPVIRSKTFSNLRVTTDNCDANLRATVSPSTVNVTVTGPQLWINALKISNFRLSCDLTGLPAGTYELPVLCTISTEEQPDHMVELSVGTVTVTLRQK